VRVVTAEPSSLETFVRAHSRSLFGTAYLLTGEAAAAEDLVQDTLASLLPKWSMVERADAPVAYARRALVNRFVSSRRVRRAPAVLLDDVPEPADELDVAEHVADRDLLFNLLTTLPARQRAAVVLRYLHAESDAAIAESLGCRQATVRSLVSRGIAALRVVAADGQRTETTGENR
jgi:RNA polymerase sigma-70 factor (sigma-E family)